MLAEKVLEDLRYRPLPKDVHRRIELCALAVLDLERLLRVTGMELRRVDAD